MSRSLYRVSWLSSAGSEFTFESDPHDAIDIAHSNDGIITYGGEDYTADELASRLLATTLCCHYVLGVASDGSLEIFEECIP